MSNNPIKSVASVDSVASVGIGDNLTTLQRQKDSGLPKLVPEGATAITEPVYDSIVYLIYCPEHDQIAVTNVDKVRCIWLPFVALPEGVTWQKASHDGVAILIGRQDAEMDADEAEKTAPIYTMSYLHMLRIQLPSSKMIMRLTQFVHLMKNEFFKCCQNTDRVNWIPSNDILTNKVAKVWGPELKILTSMLVSSQPHIISEFTLNNTLYYLYLHDSPEQKVLFDAKIDDHHVYDIYNDYVEHCYPSFYMCFESFRAYLVKYKHPDDHERLRYLFNAFSTNRRSFIDFHEFLIGLLIMEPKCTNSLEARVQLIYRYYDFEQKGSLSATNIFNMLKDIYPSLDDSKLLTYTQTLLKNRLSQNVSYGEFVVLVPDFVSKLINLCRSPKSILSQMSQLMMIKTQQQIKLNTQCDAVVKAKRVTKGTCPSCRAQAYEYGNHCITIDTIGRCVEPKIISKAWLNVNQSVSNTMNRNRYSLEYVFTISSVPNIFIDLIRDFYHKQDNKLPGLMAVPEDWPTFNKYLNLLCKELNAILLHEEKLIKINAPAIVVGDLQGSLPDLLQLEKMFFQSFPVISENLIFLGNYTGDNPNGIECLIYLFALKLCSPNKVYLVRGSNELQERAAGILHGECIQKYGATFGNSIYGILLEIFSKLPIAVLVDENILCVHSGIPTSSRLDRFYKLPKEMCSVEREHPFAYEVLTRYPRNTKSAELNSTDNLKCANVSKILFGAKSGDTEFHINFKSDIVKSKSKSGCRKQPKSLLINTKSKKSLMKKSCGSMDFAACKSIKSRKSLSSVDFKSQNKSFESTKSIKSFSISASNSSNSLIMKSGSQKFPSNTGNNVINFNFKSIKSTKLKPTFLKSLKINRKSIKFKSPLLSTGAKSSKFPTTKSAKMKVHLHNRRNTFDRHELFDYLKANELSFLIRSHSVCANGYKLNFDSKCLTVFSCSNYRNTNNQAAVALIDSSNHAIRFIRFESAKNVAH